MIFEWMLAKCGRRIGYHRGSRYWGKLWRNSVTAYQSRPDRWVIINDYDGNLKLQLDRGSYLGSLIYWRGGQPTYDFALLRQVLRPDMVFVDVGANQGEATLVAAKRLLQGHVLAFEPVASLYAQLSRNLALNRFSNVTALNCALSDYPGTMPMYTSLDTEIHASFNEGLASFFPSDYRNTRMGEVRVRVLDECLAELNIDQVHLMKIDVEGAELHVLRGSFGTLQRWVPGLLMEINPSALAAAGTDVAELWDLVISLGYQVYVIGRGGKLTQVFAHTALPACDAYCVHRSKVNQLPQ